MYARSRWGVVLAREDFDTADDAAAQEIAQLVGNASLDRCDSCELWQGDRCVPIPPGAATVRAATQQRALEREERLLTSRWAIAKSQRLRELTGRGGRRYHRVRASASIPRRRLLFVAGGAR